MYAYEAEFSIARTTPQHRTYSYTHWNKQKEGNVNEEKHHHLGFEPRTTR